MRIEKRNSWVEYLNEKQRGTETVVYNVDEKERMANTTFTQEEVEKRILNIIVEPNPQWRKLKKTDRYKPDKTFFGH